MVKIDIYMQVKGQTEKKKKRPQYRHNKMMYICPNILISQYRHVSLEDNKQHRTVYLPAL